MSQTITIANFYGSNLKEASAVDADAAAGVTTLKLKYTDNFAANDFLYVGDLGGESSEICSIQSVTNATDIVLKAATTKYHSRFNPVRSLFGDKIKIYRAPNVSGYPPETSDFVLVDTINIDYDQVETQYIDSTGSDAYWYNYTYANSYNSTETSLGDSSPVRGGNAGNYCSVASIRSRAGMGGNKWITDATIDVHRQAAQTEINSNLTGLYSLPFTSPINPLIKEIAIKLAAGFLLLDDYGPVNVLNTTNGQKMVDDARAMIARIKNKELVLGDALGNSTAIEGSNSFTTWPDATTATTATTDGSSGGGERMFRVSKRY